MSIRVPQELLNRAVMRFETEVRRKTLETPPRPARVMTISRQLGSGGRRIAEALARELDWLLWDKEILEVLATQSHLGYQARVFDAIDDRTRGSIDDAVYALLGDVSKHVYLHLLPRAILTVAQHDAIILGRGAHLLLPEALRIRLEAPLARRVENLVRFEALTEKAARERIRTSDREREAFVRELAARLGRKRSPGARSIEYDLSINTERFSVEECVALILAAAGRRFGLGTERSQPETRDGPSADFTNA